MNFKEYSVEIDGIEGICRSPSFWGDNGNNLYPLVYFRKPKWMTDKDFKHLVTCLHLALDVNYEFHKEI